VYTALNVVLRIQILQEVERDVEPSQLSYAQPIAASSKQAIPLGISDKVN
jgi:hypothetical protein